MKKIRFIVNPFSGIGRQKVVEQLINERLDMNIFQPEIVYTNAPKHAIVLSAEAASNNFDFVVAVGGDGSVNEVCRGLIHTNTTMAILPAGSGNGLARDLKIPMNLVKAIELINKGNTTTIDTIKLNNEVFAGMAGIGFDAHISWEFSKYGKRGFASYIKLVLREYPKYKCKDYELIIDGKPIKSKALLISFANMAQYGNNAYISPKALLHDGLIDVCILKQFPLAVLPHLVYRLFTQTIHESRFVNIIQGKEIEVKQKSKIAHIDGEAIECGEELKIKIDPLSLKIITP